MKIPDYSSFLKTLTPAFTPVLDGGFAVDDYTSVDLSVYNTELKNVDTASAKGIGAYIQHKLDKQGAKVGYGGYLEHRSIYDRSTHFKTFDNNLKRNIHLGLDLWSEEDTAVLAPIEGRVHSFKDNRNFGDYGPCILLEHHFDDITLYTLYGHLDRQSLQEIKKGDVVNQGQAFARLGGSGVNGDYAPHLHFQIIIDVSGYDGDYPGVSSRNDLPYYKANCPDPNLLLKLE